MLETGFSLWPLWSIRLAGLGSLVLFVSAFAFAFAGNSPPGSPRDLTGNSPPAPLFLSCDLWYANDLLKRGVYDLTN